MGTVVVGTPRHVYEHVHLLQAVVGAYVENDLKLPVISLGSSIW